MKNTIKHGALFSLLSVLLTVASTAPGVSAIAATPSGAAVERPSILQTEDNAHRADAIQLAADTQQNGVFTRTQPRAQVRQPQAQGAQVFNNSGLSREVFGYATYWELANGDLSDVNYDKVSTIAYFGLTYTAPGTFDNSDGGAAGWNSAALTNMVNQAHSFGDKVVVTVKSFDNGTIGSIVNNPSNGQAAIDSAVNAVVSRGLDGVNVDFEGNDPNLQQPFVNWIAKLSNTLHTDRPGSFVTVDGYSGSASWSGGFIRVDTLAPYVDAFFIMAYDMAFSNASDKGVPVTLPNAPLAGSYTYYDTQSVDQYVSKTGDPNKVMLGVPYYGYKSSTLSAGFNAPTNPNDHGSCAILCADTYSNIRFEFTCAQSLSFNWDAASSTPWAVWNSPGNDPCTAPSPGHNSIRELYYDDGSSLSAKYDMINNRNIRGVGMWALGYDHGYSDLWGAIAAKLMCPPAPSYHVNGLAASQASTKFNVSWSANPGSSAASSFQLWVQDGAGPWQRWVSTGAGSRDFYGFAGHTYSFYVQAYGSCQNAPGPGAAQASTTVSGGATNPNPYTGMYTLDGFGGVHGVQSPPLTTSAYWPGWDIARSLSSTANGQGGYVLDGWGGVHAYGAANGSVQMSAYWPGWNIARDVATLPDGSGGYTLDGYGGVHPFATGGHAMPPAVPDSSHAYWGGWDIARKLVIFPDGSGGYTLDGWGGVHAFATAGHAMPAAVPDSSHAYWSGWDIARSIALVPGTHVGYTMDGWGGVHNFAPSGSATPAAVGDFTHAYWPSWDIAKAVVISPQATAGSPAGWVLDGYGGVHQFGSAPAVTFDAYWPGWNIARGISGG